MLYISLILITAGILFILYTLISRTRKHPVRYNSIKDMDINISEAMAGTYSNKKPVRLKENNNYTDNTNGYQNKNNRIETSSDLNLNESFPEEKKDNESIEADRKNVDNIIEEQNYRGKPGEDISIIPDVSLYEDSSNIIDYVNNDSIIDSSLSEYKKIRRIGEGNIELLNDGINFRTENKLFRFDYHRIDDVKKGKNYFVLIMKGSNINRIFVFKNNALLNTKLNQFYRNDSSSVK